MQDDFCKMAAAKYVPIRKVRANPSKASVFGVVRSDRPDRRGFQPGGWVRKGRYWISLHQYDAIGASTEILHGQPEWVLIRPGEVVGALL